VVAVREVEARDAHARAEKRLELGNIPGHRAEGAHDVGAVLDGGDALDARVLAVDACALMWVGMEGGESSVDTRRGGGEARGGARPRENKVAFRCAFGRHLDRPAAERIAGESTRPDGSDLGLNR
jgi:hypothetical protein